MIQHCFEMGQAKAFSKMVQHHLKTGVPFWNAKWGTTVLKRGRFQNGAQHIRLFCKGISVFLMKTLPDT